MSGASAIVVCLGYILGLLSTGAPASGYSVLGLGILLAIVLPLLHGKLVVRPGIWILAGGIGLVASLYFQSRLPYPTSRDISQLIPNNSAIASPVEAIVEGTVRGLPQQTRDKNTQFWVEVRQVKAIVPKVPNQPALEEITGTLYVTVPASSQVTIAPNQTVSITGPLYRPKTALNPGGFNFQSYLQRENCFAGMRAQTVTIVAQSSGWSLWQIQQQIVRSQRAWLPDPHGALISSMVLGSRGVNLPVTVKTQFTQAGLAHALAASGFQTSLILGVILAITHRWSERVQFTAGTIALGVFVGLAGAHPAVLRAAIMGFGGLVALAIGQKVRPLGSLLVTAVILLVINPLWIWDLGFQLSFLATMGLLVSVPTIAAFIDWLPSAVACAIAVPIAAYIWTLPLQLLAFGVVSPYSIPINILATPLVSILSLGGMVSALASVVWSPAGSAIAWALHWPSQALLWLVNTAAQLPGSTYATGTIPLWSAIALYGLIGLVWLSWWWQPRWWLALAIGLGLIVVPIGYAQVTLERVTVLATSGSPMMVVQARGQTGLIGTNDSKTLELSVLPFLRRSGVNRVDWAVWLNRPTQPGKSPARTPGSDRLSIQKTYSLTDVKLGQPLRLGPMQLKRVQLSPAIAEIRLPRRQWLWLGGAPAANLPLPKVDVIWWPGGALKGASFKAIKPRWAIAYGANLNESAIALLKPLKTQVYWTRREGAVQWTPRSEFQAFVNSNETMPTGL